MTRLTDATPCNVRAMVGDDRGSCNANGAAVVNTHRASSQLSPADTLMSYTSVVVVDNHDG